MLPHHSHIDPYLFEKQLHAFRSFVREKSGVAFVSFASNWYTDDEEGYKSKIHSDARNALGFRDWKPADIGAGRIANAVIKAIELPKNNLVTWRKKYGADARHHQPLYEALGQREHLPAIEEPIFQLFHDERDEDSFSRLLAVFGGKYPMLTYLFFLKDCQRYLPVRPERFDDALQYLGVSFQTNRHCSWQNYLAFLGIMKELRDMLAESLAVEVSLLDAHSFAWMLASQMAHENKLADVREYQSLSDTEREAIIKARVGQGRFRQSLVEYWSCCAVTGCAEVGLLRASHIKPWAGASLSERLDLYNGLLLSPTLETSFDGGYISFDDDGRILISARLGASDAAALGIHTDMHLRKVETEHRKHLAWHRSRWGFDRR